MDEEATYTVGSPFVVIESPLKKWPGRIQLPDPDEFSGEDWDAWRRCLEAYQKQPTINRMMGYAGVRFVAARGVWEIDGLTALEVGQWADNPAQERTKFVSWLGRQMQQYIEAIADPKE